MTTTTIDSIIEELNSSNDIHNVLRVIYSYYLNEKDKEFYYAAMLNYSGKPQKEIGILLNIMQPHVSKFIALLIAKMRRLASLFTTDKDAFISFIELLRAKLTVCQFRLVSLSYSGHSYSEIARILQCSPANISKMKSQINHRLTKQEARLLKHYKDIILG